MLSGIAKRLTGSWTRNRQECIRRFFDSYGNVGNMVNNTLILWYLITASRAPYLSYFSFVFRSGRIPASLIFTILYMYIYLFIYIPFSLSRKTRVLCARNKIDFWNETAYFPRRMERRKGSRQNKNERDNAALVAGFTIVVSPVHCHGPRLITFNT